MPSYLALKKTEVDPMITWRTNHEPYFNRSLEGNNFYVIDLELIPTPANLPTWLRDNFDKIDFLSSWGFIESIHRYPKRITGVEITSYRIEEFKNLINTRLPPNYRFETLTYDFHLSLKPNTAQTNLDINPIAFDTNESCYSLPFLNSILMVNSGNLNSDSEIVFLTLEDHTFIQLYTTTGMITYDFSDNPTKLEFVEENYYYV